MPDSRPEAATGISVLVSTVAPPDRSLPSAQTVFLINQHHSEGLTHGRGGRPATSPSRPPRQAKEKSNVLSPTPSPIAVTCSGRSKSHGAGELNNSVRSSAGSTGSGPFSAAEPRSTRGWPKTNVSGGAGRCRFRPCPFDFRLFEPSKERKAYAIP